MTCANRAPAEPVNERPVAYTHWAFFGDESVAWACAADLPNFVTRVEEINGKWLLLAGRDVTIAALDARHEVERIMARHGGAYHCLDEASYLASGDGFWSRSRTRPDRDGGAA